MSLSIRKFSCAAAAALLLTGLCGCGAASRETVPTEPEVITLPTAPIETTAETSPLELIEHLDAVMIAGELYTLEHYPNLKSVNLSGSTCYRDLLEFEEQHPDLDVTFTVPVGSAVISNKETGTVLSPGEFEYGTLMDAFHQSAQQHPERRPGPGAEGGLSPHHPGIYRGTAGHRLRR